LSEILWSPDRRDLEQSALARFQKGLARQDGTVGQDYASLWQWSVDHPERFWPAVADFFGTRFDGPPRKVCTGEMPETRWFEGTRLNYARHLVDTPRPGGFALIFRNEAGLRLTLTDDELRHAVAALAADFQNAGVQPGDRIAAYLPNHPAAIVTMLAASSLGAIFTSASPDFGVEGVLDRFGQVAPKVLVAIDGYPYGGKRYDVRGRVREIASRLPSLRRLIVVPYLMAETDLAGLPHAVSYPDLLEKPTGSLTYTDLPFDHPLYILYSSGTTGQPKCMIHRQGGVLLQHLKELGLHTDVGSGDRLFYFTTTGWMMWNWMASGLALGATLILYDGSPIYPHPDALLRVIEEEGIGIFGTSARYLRTLETSRVRCEAGQGLEGLRTILSTGSPLLPEQFDYVYRDLKPDLRLNSISGGTDLVSCFVLGAPTLPIRRGEIQCRGLGMAVAIYDSEGRPVVGERGELVCTRPFPTLPLGFWDDPDRSRYRAAYFTRFPGVWCHGDFAALTQMGGVIIYGRSDTVLNPGGVRIGTAEIYRQVEIFDEIAEAVVVGAPDGEGSERILLFVVLREGARLDEALERRIRERIRTALTPRHVPARIQAVPDIPRTRSGKISEMAVRQVVAGEAVANTGALANPESLEAFRVR
jgi:acetoacetyl-CoA synthetase